MISAGYLEHRYQTAASTDEQAVARDMLLDFYRRRIAEKDAEIAELPPNLLRHPFAGGLPARSARHRDELRLSRHAQTTRPRSRSVSQRQV